MGNTGKMELILTRFNCWDTDVEKQEYIDTLEGFLEKCNKEARDGNTTVPDSIYDTCMDFLREIKPDSYLLHQVWSEDDASVIFDVDLDKYLIKHPMLSIQTVKNMTDKPFKDFQNKLSVTPIDVVCSIKENGHGVRIIYKDGVLVKAHSRGRSTNGRDLTKQMVAILGGENKNISDLGVVELRCEALLPFRNVDKARVYNPGIKSAFSGVASMIRESATIEESRLLDVVVYDILTDKKKFNTLSQKFEFLTSCGFVVPLYLVKKVTRGYFCSEVNDILLRMDIMCTDYDYYTDGVVLAVDNLAVFNTFGSEDKFRLGNLALKMGRWRQDNYVGVVERIDWVEGKSKKTPVAILEEGVMTATGNTVTNVPLYAPCYILMLGAYPGRELHFKYGGEAGVVPITMDGRLVTELRGGVDIG